jgi:preprotein translocase subunit SecE
MNENTKIQPKAKKTDTSLWIIIGVLTAAAIVADRYFSEVVLALRLAGWIIFACILVFLIALTEKGKSFWKFIKDVRMEMRKVVWPTRQETTRTTLLVAAMVVVAALIMWGVDSILLVLIGWLTGQG